MSNETNKMAKNTGKYDQPHPSWKIDKDGIYGERIFLPNILNAFSGDFMICEDFVSIVGGLCNFGSTKGDIDVLLKSPSPKERSPLGMATKFRIARALAKIGIKESRIQFLYDDFSGPFTNHVHLYDLVLRKKPNRELHEMSELQKGITPFKFFVQPKPLHGRHREEIYSPETVTEVIQSLKKWQTALAEEGIIVEKKFDGTRCQGHKVGSKVKILTEEKTNITDKLPTLVNEFKKINHDFVVEFEIELWLKGEHQNRADTAGVIHEKGISKLEKNIVANFYDLLWLDGKDIHTDPFIERTKKMGVTFPSTEKIGVSKIKMVNSLDELKKEVLKVSKLPGSEGAMIKIPSYVYPLKPHTSEIIKFKNEFSIDVEVVEVHQVRNSKARNYLTAVRKGKDFVPCGRTYNTNISAGVGDALKVVFVELSKYIDPDTKEIWYNFWSPRVIEKSKKADVVETAERLVKQSGGQVEEKRFPTRYKDLLDEEDYFSEFERMALREQTEEFEFSLSNGWLNDSLIPQFLASGKAELRNKDNFIIKKNLGLRSIICLRDNNNKIQTEKSVTLMEV